MKSNRNVLGTRLEACSLNPLTGFNCNGHCQTAEHDIGVHGVCSEVTEDFLNFTKARGNDLSSPNKLYGFPGLKPDVRWCLCASPWKQALDHEVAPPIVLSATSEAVLEYVGLEELLKYAVDNEH